MAPSAVTIADIEDLSARVGRLQWADWPMWYGAQQHPSASAIPALVEEYVSLIRASTGLSKKVLVLDLDNTCWGGVIGEDGLQGIKLGGPSPAGEAFQDFQRYVLRLKQRGIVLCVCSKNNEPDARLPFEKHEASVLKMDDFAVFKANWRSKSENIREIANILNLGLDSFVFLDDNPVERGLVRLDLPEVAVPELPTDPALYIRSIECPGYFTSAKLSEEDLTRAENYRIEAVRAELKSTASSLDEYLSRLQMTAEIGSFDDHTLPRIAQLLGKTNQFNLTTRRHTEEALRVFSRSNEYWTKWYRLRDRFGEHGLVGVLIAKQVNSETWEVDTWLMSCRVIGRQMEDFMLDRLILEANQRGVKRLIGKYLPTAKNSLVADLYPRMGFKVDSVQPDNSAEYHIEVSTYEPRAKHIEFTEKQLT